MSSSARLIVHDGHDSIGGTKIQFEQGDVRLLLDFGTNYQRMGRFYEEFLQPRPARGLVDFLATGMLPEIRGAYRRDLFPSHDYPSQDDGWQGARPTAVLLSHGHLDHCGAIAFLDPTIPIVATPMTLALLRSWQETGKVDTTTEITFYGPKAPAEEAGKDKGSLPGRLLVGDRDAVRSTRPFQLLSEAPGALVDALRHSPFAGKTKFEPIDPVPAGSRFDSVEFVAHEVDHSVYGAAGFLLEADGGCVAYTGDIRFHGERGRSTGGFLTLLEKKSPEVLLVEGTRLLGPGEVSSTAPTSEAEVERNCRRELEAYGGRLVVADFGPRNVERLRTFERIAQAVGRQLVLTPKDAYLLHMLHTVDPSIPVDISPGGMRVLEEPSTGHERAWLHRVYANDSSAFLNPTEVARDKGRYVLCFSFFDCNDLVDLRSAGATDGGLWLYSSSEAHGEEQEFDFLRLQNWIRWAGMHQVGFRYLPDGRGGERLAFDHPEDIGHHASGHATQAELVEFVRRARPKRIVPVHTVQPPRRYEELLRSVGSKATVVAPRPGTPITW